MQSALITGAGSLIGAAIAERLIKDGWRVVLTDLGGASAENLHEMPEKHPGVEFRPMDVTDRAQVVEVMHAVRRAHGPLRALVNVAGGGRGLGIPLKDFLDFAAEERRRMLEMNLASVLRCTHAVLPQMIEGGGGAIVSITAGRGLRGGPRASLYSGAKAGIIRFSQALSGELREQNIRVNTVAPGNTAARWKHQAGAVRSPLGRSTEPDDVGAAVAFLVSDRAAAVTGACLDVSGGTALH